MGSRNVIDGLTIIGEASNDSVPGTKAMFDAGDLAGIQALAAAQVAEGALLIDVNVGRRGPAFMQDVVRAVQQAVKVPLSLDSPDCEILGAALDVYDAAAAGGPPVLNSISAARTEMFALTKKQPCRAVLLLTERKEGAECKPCATAEEEYAVAKELVELAAAHGMTPGDVFLDPGIMPVGADSRNGLRRTLRTLELTHADAVLSRCHASVGLSNFTVMLPRRRPDGRPIRSALESAFLTLAMPHGLDTVIGSVKRSYTRLAEDDAALVCLKEILELDGFACIARLDEFCRG